MPRLRPATAVLAGALAASGSRAAAAPATVLGSGDVVVGAGHDNNILLQVSPDAGSREAAVQGFYARTAPSLGAALSFGPGYRVDAGYSLDFRATQGAGNLLRHELELSLAFPKLGPLVPRIGGSAGRFDAGDFPQDRFLWAAGELALRLELTASLRVLASYRGELRSYPDRPGGEERDLVHSVELRLAYRPGPRFEMGVGSSYLGVVPARAAVVDDGSVRFARLGPDLEMVWRRLTFAGGMWAGVLDLPGQRQWQFGADVALVVRVARFLDASAGVDFTGTPSGDPLAQNYSRRFLGVALIAHATGKRALGGTPEPPELRPVVREGRVRFRARAPGATGVVVIGSWDDWSPEGQPLAATSQPGLWEGWVSLPPGSHRYRFVVDGRPVAPADAPRYVPDDFGGQDAVVDVPEPP